MLGRFLQKLFPAAPLSPATQDALRELEQLRERQPSLRGLAEVLAEVMPLLEPKADAGQVPVLTGEQARTRLSAGIPLLRNLDCPLGLPSLRDRWLRLAEIITRHRTDAAGSDLAAAVRSGRINLEDWFKGLLAEGPARPQAAATRLGLDADLAVTLLRFTLMPELTRLADDLTPLRQGIAWERGDCPTCGNQPLLAELRGLEQKRWLRCGWCASGWEVQRLFCPFCGNRDHRSLLNVRIEETGINRYAAACELCQRYVKTTPTLTAPSAIQLLVLDLELLHLDLIMRERGTEALLAAPSGL